MLVTYTMQLYRSCKVQTNSIPYYVKNIVSRSKLSALYCKYAKSTGTANEDSPGLPCYPICPQRSTLATRGLTWNTVTVAQRKVLKCFRSQKHLTAGLYRSEHVQSVASSVRTQNLPPNKCIPKQLRVHTGRSDLECGPNAQWCPHYSFHVPNDVIATPMSFL